VVDTAGTFEEHWLEYRPPSSGSFVQAWYWSVEMRSSAVVVAKALHQELGVVDVVHGEGDEVVAVVLHRLARVLTEL